MTGLPSWDTLANWADALADGIEAGADRPLSEQLADLAAAHERFLVAAAAVPADRREFTVLSAQGREIPAREVPWLRVREAWLHLVDLDAGYDIDVVPADVAWTLAARHHQARPRRRGAGCGGGQPAADRRLADRPGPGPGRAHRRR